MERSSDQAIGKKAAIQYDVALLSINPIVCMEAELVVRHIGRYGSNKLPIFRSTTCLTRHIGHILILKGRERYILAGDLQFNRQILARAATPEITAGRARCGWCRRWKRGGDRSHDWYGRHGHNQDHWRIRRRHRRIRRGHIGRNRFLCRRCRRALSRRSRRIFCSFWCWRCRELCSRRSGRIFCGITADCSRKQHRRRLGI